MARSLSYGLDNERPFDPHVTIRTRTVDWDSIVYLSAPYLILYTAYHKHKDVYGTGGAQVA